MFKNVLVGVDGKSNGRDAIALARRLTDPGAKVTLVHVHAGEHNRLHAIRTDRLEKEDKDSADLLEASDPRRTSRRSSRASSPSLPARGSTARPKRSTRT